VELILSSLGISEIFDAIVTEEDVERGKPHPDAFLLAAKRCGVEPRRCVVIEDAPSGLEAAKAAGMRCIGVTGTRTKEELSLADLVVDRLEKININVIREFTL
jgi:beta-phosphoglucomutase-like phosphatase (HAD superfamily)